jgi:uncharacterized protein
VRITLRDLAVGLGIGVFSGALGVGGGILLVPFLVLALHWAQKRAQATSLVMIALASVFGALTYAIGGSINWAASGVIVVGGLLGSLVGAYVVQRTADHRLQMLFGALLLIVAVGLVFGPADPSGTALDWQVGIVIGLFASGLVMGVLSALFGIGGGILLIPILVTVFDFPQQDAAGTSLAVMAPIALLGAIRLTRPGLTDWSTGLRFGIAAALGAVLGAFLALNTPADIVRAVFAAVLALVAINMVRAGWQGRRSLPGP